MKKIEDKIPKNQSSSGAVMVGIGIVCSRASGLVRELVMAYFFGASGLADVWRVSLKIPNVIQNLLGEGTLSASVIPIYSELLDKDEKEPASQFIGAILGILLVVAGLSALVGMVVVPFLLPWIFVEWDPGKISLVGKLIKILFPMTAVLVVSAWALAILNSHRRFFLPYVAPVAWNGAIVSCVSFMAWFHNVSGEQLLVVAAWAALLGGVVQVAIQLPTVLEYLTCFRISLGKTVFGVHEAINNFIPVAMARGVVNISSLLEVILAALLAEGAIAALGYAQTLYLLPLSIFGLSVAAAELPELSRQRLAAPELLRNRIEKALARVHFWVIPSAVGFICFGNIIVAGIYHRGAFRATDVPVIYAVLAAYSLGLTASSASRVLSTGFHSLRDTRTPARLAYMRVAISLVMGSLLMFPFDRLQSGDLHYGPVGLAIGVSLAAWIEYLLLKKRLRLALGSNRIQVKGLKLMCLSSCLAVCFAYIIQFPVTAGLKWLLPSEKLFISLGQPILGIFVILIFGLSYLLLMDRAGNGWSISQSIKTLKGHSESGVE